jgi:hypothetical protein
LKDTRGACPWGGLSVHSFFCGDDDYAIAGEDTPNRSRSGIAENGHTLDIIGVDIFYVSGIREIVQDDERLGVSEYSASSADGTARLVKTAYDIAGSDHAACNTIKPVQDIGRGAAIKHFVADFYKGAGGLLGRNTLETIVNHGEILQ